MPAEKKGCLFLCPTPIGNLEDITLRVLRVLKEVPVIAAEDTRRTRKLLSHFDIQTPLISYREHNSQKQGENLLARMAGGEDVALVSDAGMPGISDPGVELVRSALETGIQVEVLPGPSAVLTGLLSSGYNPVPFTFWGFLPPGGKKRREALAGIRQEDKTLVLYEAPHRLLKTLQDLMEHGCREAVICRELTKKFAETRRGSIREHLDYFSTQKPRGEFVIVLAAGREAVPAGEEEQRPEEEAAALIEKGLTKKEAIQRVARRRGLKKSDVYKSCHRLKGADTKKNSPE